MPRGPVVFTLPPGTTPQVPNTVIASATWNAALDDIATTFNTAQPVVYGGTGATSVIAGYDALNARGTNVATAATVNLTTATGPNLHLTGATTVTAFTIGEGKVRQAIADGIFQITAGASLIVNGSASVNYTTVAGDLLTVIGDAAGVARVWIINAETSLSTYTTTATAAGTTTLTVASTYNQFFTGVTTQTAVLPVTSTLALGQPYRIVNNSTGAVTANSSGGNAVIVLPGSTETVVTCILTSGTSAASWHASAPVSLTGAQTLTNKTMSGASNTFTNIPLATAVTGTLPNANLTTDMQNLLSGTGWNLGATVFGYRNVNTAAALGDTVAGSQIEPCNSDDVPARGSALTGTAACQGNSTTGTGDQRVTNWKRVA